MICLYSLSNLSTVGTDLKSQLGDESGGLTLEAAQNWKKAEEKRNEYLAAIQENVGLSTEVTLDIDQVTIVLVVEKG